MHLPPAFLRDLDRFRAAHGVLPVVLNVNPASKMARLIAEHLFGGSLTEPQVFWLPPDEAAVLAGHPDLSPDQQAEVRALLAGPLPPGVCLVVQVNPTEYQIRRARVTRWRADLFGQLHVIPYVEPKEGEELLAEFLAEHPEWLSHVDGEKLSASAVIAFGEWTIAKEYANDPAKTRAFVEYVRGLRSAG